VNSEPRVRQLFPTPLIEFDLAQSDALNHALMSVIRARQASAPGISRSNYLGWHSDSEMLKWGGEAAKKLGLETLRLCGRFTQDVGLKTNEPRYEMGLEMWANVSPPGASNQMHAHPGALWSAVYYVDDGGDPAGGALALLDPRFPMSRMYAPDLIFGDTPETRPDNIVHCAPTPGRLLIFPAWLMHGVAPHAGPRERISIAMNVLAIPARR